MPCYNIELSVVAVFLKERRAAMPWALCAVMSPAWWSERLYTQYPFMYHPPTRTAMQENVAYKRPRRDQK